MTLHPRDIPRDSLHPTTGWFKFKGPTPLPLLGTFLNGHPSFRTSYKIGWGHCCNYMYHHSTSSAISWFSCFHKFCWDDSPVNLQMQIPGSVFASWGTQLAIGQEETRQDSQFSSLLHQPHMATKALLNFSFPLHEPSLSLSPSPESGNTAREQNGHSSQQGYSLSGIPIHLVLVAFTALTSLNICIILVGARVLGCHDLLHRTWKWKSLDRFSKFQVCGY